MIKPIDQIIPPPDPHWVGDGFRVHNFVPTTMPWAQRLSPFILLDYNARIEFAPNGPRRGVGVHPHRGFETVTLALHGQIAHHDSAGNAGVIGPGDVQWMTAGAGVLHKEYHHSDYSRSGGPFQMVQLWVNLPARHKMTPPRYQDLPRAAMPIHSLPNNGGQVCVIAGSFAGLVGPAQTFSPIELWDISLSAHASFEAHLPAHYHVAALVLDGSLQVQGRVVPTDNLVLFGRSGELLSWQAEQPARVLLMAGEPIDEPMVHYGPFVMNTREEIRQAYDDLAQGRFGYLAH